MSDIRVRVSDENLLKVRVGQQNSVKVVSSLNGSILGIPTYSDSSGIALSATTATNVIGGIASVSNATINQLSVTGISSFTLPIGYSIGNYSPPNGVGYFDSQGKLVSSASTNSLITYSNYMFTTNNLGIPAWSNQIDGGEY